MAIDEIQKSSENFCVDNYSESIIRKRGEELQFIIVPSGKEIPLLTKNISRCSLEEKIIAEKSFVQTCVDYVIKNKNYEIFVKTSPINTIPTTKLSELSKDNFFDVVEFLAPADICSLVSVHRCFDKLMESKERYKVKYEKLWDQIGESFDDENKEIINNILRIFSLKSASRNEITEDDFLRIKYFFFEKMRDTKNILDGVEHFFFKTYELKSLSEKILRKIKNHFKEEEFAKEFILQIYKRIIQVCINKKDYKRAEKIIFEYCIQDNYYRQPLIFKVVKAYLSKGKKEECRKLMRTFIDEELLSSLLRKMGEQYDDETISYIVQGINKNILDSYLLSKTKKKEKFMSSISNSVSGKSCQYFCCEKTIDDNSKIIITKNKDGIQFEIQEVNSGKMIQVSRDDIGLGSIRDENITQNFVRACTVSVKRNGCIHFEVPSERNEFFEPSTSNTERNRELSQRVSISNENGSQETLQRPFQITEEEKEKMITLWKERSKAQEMLNQFYKSSKNKSFTELDLSNTETVQRAFNLPQGFLEKLKFKSHIADPILKVRKIFIKWRKYIRSDFLENLKSAKDSYENVKSSLFSIKKEFPTCDLNKIKDDLNKVDTDISKVYEDCFSKMYKDFQEDVNLISKEGRVEIGLKSFELCISSKFEENSKIIKSFIKLEQEKGKLKEKLEDTYKEREGELALIKEQLRQIDEEISSSKGTLMVQEIGLNSGELKDYKDKRLEIDKERGEIKKIIKRLQKSESESNRRIEDKQKEGWFSRMVGKIGVNEDAEELRKREEGFKEQLDKSRENLEKKNKTLIKEKENGKKPELDKQILEYRKKIEYFKQEIEEKEKEKVKRKVFLENKKKEFEEKIEKIKEEIKEKEEAIKDPEFQKAKEIKEGCKMILENYTKVWKDMENLQGLCYFLQDKLVDIKVRTKAKAKVGTIDLKETLGNRMEKGIKRVPKMLTIVKNLKKDIKSIRYR
ncbi:MAG: hypothetical protein AMS24_00365 [Chlamydiae bacterium SM23_39]|nr:MAG: hypothetical protein AMS24_00365 [Chlamydiae bacterium SM23_39]